MADTDPLLGKLVAGRYRVQRALGRGGMGAVYVATQEPLGREVALKVLRPNLADDAVAIERFRNEARLIAALHHPHIVSIHDFDTTPDGVLYIAMELLQGESLAARLKRTGRMPPAHTTPIVRDVARALAAAHRKGVVHRDLKPDNIVLADAAGIGEHAKVLDFGIAKLFTEEGGHQSLTGTGLVPGTPGYISPEQIAGTAHDDPRSDLYALGVTWFELLTGTRPFKADHALQLFMLQLNEDVPRPSAVAPDAHIPPALDELVLWLTQKDPAKRPASADAFLERLATLPGLWAPPTTLSPAALATPSPTEVSAMPTLDATPAPPLVAPPRPAAPAAASADASAAMTRVTPAHSATPHTGTGTVVAPRGRARKKKAALVVAALVVGVIGVRFAIGGDAHEKLENDIEGAFDLPVHTKDDELGLMMRDAKASYRRGDLAAATRYADAVLAKAPDEPGAYLIRALVALHEEQWFDTQRYSTAARESVRDGVQDRGEAPAAVKLIELLEVAAREKTAAGIAQWRDCYPCQGFPIGDVAVARAATAHDGSAAEEALALIRRATAADPGFVLAYVEEANIHLSLGDGPAARAAAESGLRDNPNVPVLVLVHARALLAVGAIDEAEREVKRALSMNPGRGADLLLARVALLRGDEARRTQLIEAQLASALPDAEALIAIDHGEALAGAGRFADSIALFERAMRTALESELPELATYVLLRATRAVGPVAEAGGAAQHKLIALADEVLKEPALPQVPRNVLAAVRTVIEIHTILAAAGPDAARKRIARLSEIDPAFLAPELRRRVLATVDIPVSLAEGHFDDALRDTDLIDAVCNRHADRARVFVTRALADARAQPARHDETVNESARRELSWLRDHASACRALGAQGVAVLIGLALEAELQATLHQDAEARATVDAIAREFPRADADVRGLAAARALLPPARP